MHQESWLPIRTYPSIQISRLLTCEVIPPPLPPLPPSLPSSVHPTHCRTTAQGSPTADRKTLITTAWKMSILMMMEDCTPSITFRFLDGTHHIITYHTHPTSTYCCDEHILLWHLECSTRIHIPHTWQRLRISPRTSMNCVAGNGHCSPKGPPCKRSISLLQFLISVSVPSGKEAFTSWNAEMLG